MMSQPKPCNQPKPIDLHAYPLREATPFVGFLDDPVRPLGVELDR
jgi:hypothetical protein